MTVERKKQPNSRSSENCCYCNKCSFSDYENSVKWSLTCNCPKGDCGFESVVHSDIYDYVWDDSVVDYQEEVWCGCPCCCGVMGYIPCSPPCADARPLPARPASSFAPCNLPYAPPRALPSASPHSSCTSPCVCKGFRSALLRHLRAICNKVVAEHVVKLRGDTNTASSKYFSVPDEEPEVFSSRQRRPTTEEVLEALDILAAVVEGNQDSEGTSSARSSQKARQALSVIADAINRSSAGTQNFDATCFQHRLCNSTDCDQKQSSKRYIAVDFGSHQSHAIKTSSKHIDAAGMPIVYCECNGNQEKDKIPSQKRTTSHSISDEEREQPAFGSSRASRADRSSPVRARSHSPTRRPRSRTPYLRSKSESHTPVHKSQKDCSSFAYRPLKDDSVMSVVHEGEFPQSEKVEGTKTGKCVGFYDDILQRKFEDTEEDSLGRDEPVVDEGEENGEFEHPPRTIGNRKEVESYVNEGQSNIRAAVMDTVETTEEAGVEEVPSKSTRSHNVQSKKRDHACSIPCCRGSRNNCQCRNKENQVPETGDFQLLSRPVIQKYIECCQKRISNNNRCPMRKLFTCHESDPNLQRDGNKQLFCKPELERKRRMPIMKCGANSDIGADTEHPVITCRELVESEEEAILDEDGEFSEANDDESKVRITHAEVSEALHLLKKSIEKRFVKGDASRSCRKESFPIRTNTIRDAPSEPSADRRTVCRSDKWSRGTSRWRSPRPTTARERDGFDVVSSAVTEESCTATSFPGLSGETSRVLRGNHRRPASTSVSEFSDDSRRTRSRSRHSPAAETRIFSFRQSDGKGKYLAEWDGEEFSGRSRYRPNREEKRALEVVAASILGLPLSQVDLENRRSAQSRETEFTKVTPTPEESSDEEECKTSVPFYCSNTSRPCPPCWRCHQSPCRKSFAPRCNHPCYQQHHFRPGAPCVGGGCEIDIAKHRRCYGCTCKFANTHVEMGRDEEEESIGMTETVSVEESTGASRSVATSRRRSSRPRPCSHSCAGTKRDYSEYHSPSRTRRYRSPRKERTCSTSQRLLETQMAQMAQMKEAKCCCSKRKSPTRRSTKLKRPQEEPRPMDGEWETKSSSPFTCDCATWFRPRACEPAARGRNRLRSRSCGAAAVAATRAAAAAVTASAEAAMCCDKQGRCPSDNVCGYNRRVCCGG